MNVGILGLRTARRMNVTYHTYLASGGRLSYSPGIEHVHGSITRKCSVLVLKILPFVKYAREELYQALTALPYCN